jgi:hypothetical protein
MRLYEKLIISFLTFFAIAAIVAVALQFKIFENYIYNQTGQTREILSNKFPKDKVEAVNLFKSKYNNKFYLLRSMIEVQQQMLSDLNTTEDNINKISVEYHKLLNENIVLFKECNKNIKNILTKEELEIYQIYDRICYFRF